MRVVEVAMRELMALGVDGEALIAAVSRIAEASAEDRHKSVNEVVATIAEQQISHLPPYDPEEHRKALGRARQARYEEAKRQRASERRQEPSDLTQPDAKEVSPTPPSENTPIPPLKGGTFPKNQHPSEKPEGTSAELAGDDQTPSRSARRKPSRPIPDDFPTAELIAEAQARAAEAGADLDIGREAERFRNWALGKDARYVNWGATFRNWVGNGIERAPKIAGGPIRAGPDDPWKARLTRWRIAKYWDSDWGPKPGTEGYLGPPQDQAA